MYTNAIEAIKAQPMTNTVVPADELVEYVLELLRMVGVDPESLEDFQDSVIDYLADCDYEFTEDDGDLVLAISRDVETILSALSDNQVCISSDNGYVDFDGETVTVFIEE